MAEDTDVPSLVGILNGLLDVVASHRCPACDESLVGDARFCDSCAALLERVDRGGGVYLHYGPMADAIRRFKYGGRPEHAGVLGRHAAEGCLDHVGLVDRVVPVPLHRARRIERGYDQAALLAAEVARALTVPLDLTALERIRDTGQQVGRDRAARLRAMQGAFRAHARLRGARVLLVDDVATTGSTFDAAERACREVGARDVRRLALAAADERGAPGC